VAVIGAGPDAASVGGIVLRNLTDGSFTGTVHPVSDRHSNVRGIPAVASISALSSPPDLAIVCTPAQTVPAIVRECGEAGVAGVVVISAGFSETGERGATLEREVGEAAAAFRGLRVLGPNCLGFLVPNLGLNASFARAQPRAGGIALASQSGALITSMLDWAQDQGVGFSAVISTGNMADVDFGDLIDHLAADGQTQALILYVEAITEPRKFMSAARAFARSKPIVAYKAGRFPASAEAAASHTGALAGADDVYEAAFRRAGIVRVGAIADVFDVAQLLARPRRPRGARLAVVTNAGGPGVMAADALLARGGELASLADATLERLDAALPPQWSHGNPVDLLGDADAPRYGAAVEATLADPGANAVLTVLTPQAMTDPGAIADTVAQAAAQARKPVLAAWMGGPAVRDGRARLEAAGVPAYDAPERAVRAFTDLVEHAHLQSVLNETPRAIPVRFSLDRGRLRDLLSGLVLQAAGTLTEAPSKALLEAYGIPVTRPTIARSPDDAVAAAEQIGYPVVLKVNAAEMTHKTEAGGVVTGLRGPRQVRSAYSAIQRSATAHDPDARIDGVTVQPMATSPGHELILGARRDPVLGPVILVGAGGTAAELLADTALELPPLNERLARGMLESLRMWPLLHGYRGGPGADLDALLEALMRFSYLIADCPEIAEVDVNPLLAGPDGVVALDARVILDPVGAGRVTLPFGHLAIRPYPEELTTKANLADGRPVTLRPIKAEDEPLWREMLSASSEESRRARFRGAVRITHELAARFCFIDYDREMAIVAELQEDGRQRLAGVVRLVADAGREEAEYAVLVADPWQGLGLSTLLTDRSLEIARSWGVRRVRAETDPGNRRMLAVMRSRGFAMRTDPQDGVVHATLDLSR
jgi:acetyltransferase